MRFLKLLNYEFLRVQKIYFIILAVIALGQMVGTFISTRSIVKRAYDVMTSEGLSAVEYASKNGRFSFEYVSSTGWINATIGIGIFFIAGYIYFIWYREWFGKHPTIYGALSLPVPRIYIFFSKVITILIMTLGIIVLQVVLFPLCKIIFESVVPGDLLNVRSIREIAGDHELWRFFLPGYFSRFLFYYGAGTVVVMYNSTVILFERSMGIKGVFTAAIFTVFLGGLLYLPILGLNTILYPEEAIVGVFIAFIVVGALCSIMSNYLLNKKVTV